MKKALTFDVGGTKIYSAIVDCNGVVVSDVEKFSTPDTAEGIESVFRDVISRLEDKVDIIAFSTCGAVNNENTGIFGSTGNIASNYSSIDFPKLSSKPVFVENDADCAAWAEYKIGASKGCANSIMLTLGTGVGGGIIVNNSLLKGKSGAAGEMHFKINRNNQRKCTCGAWDCFEIYASGKGLKVTAQEITKNPDVTTYDVIEGVKNSISVYREIFDIWQNDIASGIIGLVNIFDTECIVLSGSLAQFVVTDKLERIVNSQIVTSPVKIIKAMAGNYAGMIGAGLLAIEKGVN